MAADREIRPVQRPSQATIVGSILYTYIRRKAFLFSDLRAGWNEMKSGEQHPGRNMGTRLSMIIMQPTRFATRRSQLASWQCLTFTVIVGLPPGAALS